MKKLTILILLSFLTSCGLQYTPVINTTSLHDIDFKNKNIKESKKCAYGLITAPPFFGDASVISAAKSSGFKKILASDVEVKFYGLFNKVCAVVYGEE